MIPNRLVNRIPWILIPILMVVSLYAGKAGQTDQLVMGKIDKVFSTTLNEERSLWIYLPKDYSKSRDLYPVLYLLDGKENFHHVSGVVEFLSRVSHIAPMIVVAIINTDRERDFLSTRVNNMPPVAAAGKFRDFLRNELFAFVEKKYRALPYRILCGHSFGAQFCLETFLEAPEMFTVYIAASTPFDWDDSLLIRKAKLKCKDLSLIRRFLFFSISGDDGNSIEANREFDQLLKQNPPEGLIWHFDYTENDDHMTNVHATVYNGLRWLYRGWRIPESKLHNMSLKDVRAHYRELSDRYGYTVPIPEGVLFDMGYAYLDQKRFEGAVEIFTFFIKRYPQSAFAHLGIGEVYHESARAELARKHYEICYRLAQKNNDDVILPIIKGILDQINGQTGKK